MTALPRIRISAHTLILVLALIFFDRSLTSLLPILAALCHEFGHIIVIYALGARVKEIEITIFGAEIRSSVMNLSTGGNIAVYSAGGIANLLSAYMVTLFFSSPAADIFAACSVALALLNFLPIRSLDGGCILGELLDSRFPHRGDAVFSVISSVTLMFLWIFSVFLLLNCGGNASLLLFCIYMFATLYFNKKSST